MAKRRTKTARSSVRSASAYPLRLVGISAREVINLHFGGVTTTTVVEETEGVDAVAAPQVGFRATHQNNTESDPKDLSICSSSDFVADVDVIDEAKDLELSDILHEDDKIGQRVLYFFDSRKQRVKIWPVQIDMTQNGSLPLYTPKPCRNCHHSYNTHPIGCPVKYNINITDTSSTTYKNIIAFLTEHNLPTESTDYFETEHMFCSWPCVKAYIFSCLSKNPHSHKYKNSLSYMTLMYKKIHGEGALPPIIPSAGPLGVLDAYGGHLTIEEYRSSFPVLQYGETLNVRRPYMFSCSAYIEETRVKI